MKVELLRAKKIGEKIFPAYSVVDLFQPEVEKIVADGDGRHVPDGTMARIKSYGVVGCMPPEGFESKGIEIPEATTKEEGVVVINTHPVEKQKTNTKKISNGNNWRSQQ